MGIVRKLTRKKNILKSVLKYKAKGYSYYTGKKWGRRLNNNMVSDDGYTKAQKKWALSRGFFDYSVKKYGLTEENYKDFLSDFEYTLIDPINNAYEKWLSDRLTPNYILQDFKENLPEIYCNIIKRDGEQVYIPVNGHDLKSAEDIIAFVKKKGQAVLIPSNADYNSSYLLEYNGDRLYANGEEIEAEALVEIMDNLNVYYLLRERIQTAESIRKIFGKEEVEFVFVVTNDEFHNTKILCSYAEFDKPYTSVWEEWNQYRMDTPQAIIDIETGVVNSTASSDEGSGNADIKVPDWGELCNKAVEISGFMSEIEYLSVYLKVTDKGIKVVRYSRMPVMPAHIDSKSNLNIFLKEKAADKAQRMRSGEMDTKKPFKWKVLRFLKRHYFRRGFREYMLAVWMNTVKDDLLHTKDTTLKQKIWAWRRGFPSYRIDQYGLNESNYRDVLSDYEYAWLNRINNSYQKWINDKLTMRYVLDSVKEYLPEYYFFVGTRNNRPYIKILQDCPEDCMTASVDGIIAVLREKKKLVFKPNAGTHGDGFYKIEYKDGQILVNEKVNTEEEFARIIYGQKSTYVITDYIEMHPDLKKIYPGSVNTIRVMVLNQSCDNPKITHAYMRIGSSKTGFTDNVGYGGICCYIDKDKGYFYGGEALNNHKFTPCEVHPDTGERIEGYLPDWQRVMKGIVAISACMPQLEYLGYDIALTEDGFKIIEINIHQDLHKYVKYPDEVKAFFNKKLELKREAYGIKKK